VRDFSAPLTGWHWLDSATIRNPRASSVPRPRDGGPGHSAGTNQGAASYWRVVSAILADSRTERRGVKAERARVLGKHARAYTRKYERINPARR